MEYLISLERNTTWLATAVSLCFLARLWWKGELVGTRPAVYGGWFLVAFIAQLWAPATGVWIAGLVAQLFLAITLILQDRIGNID